MVWAPFCSSTLADFHIVAVVCPWGAHLNSSPVLKCLLISTFPSTPRCSPKHVPVRVCRECYRPFVMFWTKTSHYASGYLTTHLEDCDLGGETQVFGVYSGLSLSFTALNVVHVCSSLSHVFPHRQGNVIWAALAWAGISSFLPALGKGASATHLPTLPSKLCQSWVPEWTLLNESSTVGRFWTLK